MAGLDDVRMHTGIRAMWSLVNLRFYSAVARPKGGALAATPACRVVRPVAVNPRANDFPVHLVGADPAAGAFDEFLSA